MQEGFKFNKIKFILSVGALLVWGDLWAQLEVTEQTGPYSYHTYGPNNHGDVGGYGPDGGIVDGSGYFIWHGDGSISKTDPLVPRFINDNGVWAGVRYGETNEYYYMPHAAISLAGEVIDLHILLGFPVQSGSGSQVVGLNSAGTAAISAYGYWGRRSLLWSEATGSTEIELPGNAFGPEAMNDLGDVIGQCSYPDPDTWCAYYWSPTTGYQEIFSSNYYVYPVAINDRREAVGYAFEIDPATGEYTSMQFYWKEGEGARLIARGLGQVIGINNSGVVLGWEASRSDGAYLWSADDGFLQRNIKFPGSSGTRRILLNDLGFVAGTTDGVRRNFLWTPTYGYQIIDYTLVGDVEGFTGRYIVAEGFTRYEITLPPATPVEAVAEVVEDLIELAETGLIDGGEEASLTTKLEAATTLFSDERIRPACNMLNAFVNQVEAKVLAGSIEPDAGAEIIANITSIEDCVAD